MEKLSLEEAVEKFIGGFSFIEGDLIKAVIDNDPYNFTEITPRFYEGVEVTVYDRELNEQIEGEIESINTYEKTVEIDGREYDIADIELVDEDYKDTLPMWNTFFNPDEGCDESWIENNLEKVANCGFRIYRFETTGSIYLGIDGCGYNFHEHHWGPLYKAMGFHWHTEEEENNQTEEDDVPTFEKFCDEEAEYRIDCILEDSDEDEEFNDIPKKDLELATRMISKRFYDEALDYDHMDDIVRQELHEVKKGR